MSRRDIGGNQSPLDRMSGLEDRNAESARIRGKVQDLRRYMT
ncbi:hypothetical protein [Paenibacillus sp. FSL L8-0689]